PCMCFRSRSRYGRLAVLHSVPTRRSSDLVDGVTMPADVVERLIVAEQMTELALVGWYPFSLNSRLEAAVGAASIDFERKLERIVDRKSTRLNSSHVKISYAVFCLKKKKEH